MADSPTEPEKLLVTAREAAQMLSVGVLVIYRLAAEGKLEKRYIGRGTRHFRIPVESVRHYAETAPRDPVSDEAAYSESGT